MPKVFVLYKFFTENTALTDYSAQVSTINQKKKLA